MAQFNITLTEEELHGLFLSNGRDDAVAKLLEKIFNQVLRAQSTEQLCAEPYERTEQRTAYRSGSYGRGLVTRVGTLNTTPPPTHRVGSKCSAYFFYNSSTSFLPLTALLSSSFPAGSPLRDSQNPTPTA